MIRSFQLVFLLLLFRMGYGQQNLFNIPSGDITPKGRFFYQHQLNLHRGYLESKGHLVYGLGRGWDGGLNLMGKGFFFSPGWGDLYREKPQGPQFDPVLMTSVQKQWKLSKQVSLNAGLQAGTNWGRGERERLPKYFTYLQALVHTGGGSRVVGGWYQSNEALVGAGNTRGLMLGYEWKLSKRFYLMGDWKSGRNHAGVAVLGGMMNVSKRVQVCAGLLLPNPGTAKSPGLVLELNLLGWDLEGWGGKE